MFKRLIKSKTMRQRTSWMIAGILILPFILFFHATGRTPIKGAGGTAGVVFGRQIPWETFQQQQMWVRRQWENRFGDIPEAIEGLLTQATWDRLILLEEAKRRRLRVDDRELAAFIERLPVFQEQGRFLPERYHRFLRATGMSPQQFEALLRYDLLIERLVGTIRTSVTVSEEEIRAAYEQAHARLTASLIVIEPSAFSAQVDAALTDQEVQAQYDAHPEEVRTPEQIVVEYAGATHDELSAPVRLTDEDLKTFYEDHREEFGKDDGATKPLGAVRDVVRQHAIEARVHKQLTALALDLQEDLEAKLPFDQIVKTRALTAHTAGPFPVHDLFVPNGPEPAILQAAAGLAEGQVSDLIKTDQGVYLARVTQRIAPRTPPFEEVRASVRQRLVQMKARATAKTTAEALHRRLEEQLASGVRFEEAVATSQTPVRRVSFTRTDPIEPIGQASTVNETAFATSLGTITEVLETPQGFVILRPEEHSLPSDASQFAKEHDSLREETLKRKQAMVFEQRLKDLRARAKLQNFVE